MEKQQAKRKNIKISLNYFPLLPDERLEASETRHAFIRLIISKFIIVDFAIFVLL